MKKRDLLGAVIVLLLLTTEVSAYLQVKSFGNIMGSYYYLYFTYPSPAYVGDTVTLEITPSVYTLPMDSGIYASGIFWDYTDPLGHSGSIEQTSGTQQHTYTLSTAGTWTFSPKIGWCSYQLWGSCWYYSKRSVSVSVTASKPPVKASFYSYNLDNEGTVLLDASSSNGGSGYITSYRWGPFNGIVTVKDNGVSHTVWSGGYYSTSNNKISVLFNYLPSGTSTVGVTLRVKNNLNQVDSITKYISVVKECHQANCLYTCKQICNNAYYYNSECTSTASHNSPVAYGSQCKYSWYWGDTAKDCSLHCWCYKVDTNKECSASVCTNSGWDNSPCTCTPYTCSQMGWECGSGYETNCHKYISCPSCPGGESCVDHKCVPLCSVKCQGHLSYICSSMDYSSFNPFEAGTVCYYNWTDKGKSADCGGSQKCWCYDYGTCTPPETCSSPTEGCVCVPNCTNKECGPNGCGGSCGSCGTDFCNQTTWKCQPLKKDDGEPCSSDTECNSNHCSNGYCCNAGECCSSNNDCQDNEYCSLNYNCTLCPENSCGATAVDSSFACNANEYGVFNLTKHCSLKCFNENKSKEACEICNGKAYVTAKFHSKVFDEIQKRIGMGMMSPAILTQSVCCPDATYCVFNGKCYPQATRKDVDMNGKVEICGS